MAEMNPRSAQAGYGLALSARQIGWHRLAGVSSPLQCRAVNDKNELDRRSATQPLLYSSQFGLTPIAEDKAHAQELLEN
jgi:hypothetical protein